VAWFDSLEDKAAARRSAAYAAVQIELSSPALDALFDSLGRWIDSDNGQPGIAKKMDRSIVKLAPALLAGMEGKVARPGRRIDSSDPLDLHAMRKSLKKLRYAAEDMRTVFPVTKGKRFIKSAKKLEKRFGRMSDMASARRQLTTLGEGDARLLPAI